MSDVEVEVEVEYQEEQVVVYEGFTPLPADLIAESGSVKLFNKWSFDDVEVKDVSLTDYIQIGSAVHTSLTLLADTLPSVSARLSALLLSVSPTLL